MLDSIKSSFTNYQGDINKGTVNALPQESSLFGVNLEYRNFTLGYNSLFRSNHSSLGKAANMFSYASPDNQVIDRTQRLTLIYNKVWRHFSVAANASYLRYRMDVSSSYGINYLSLASPRAYIYEASDDAFFETLGTFHINKYLELTAGFSVTFSSYLAPINESEAPFNPDDYKLFRTVKRAAHPLFGNFGDNPILHSIGGYFAQLLYQRDDLTLILGFRKDASTEFTTALDSTNIVSTVYPRVAVLYKLTDDLSMRSSYGRAFKAPSARQTYSSLALPVYKEGTTAIDSNSIQYERVPNTELKPEFVTSYELGLRYTINNTIDIDFTGYYSQIDKLITQSFIPLDTVVYGSNAESQIVRKGVLHTRSAVNSDKSKAMLYGAQLAVRLSGLFPAVKFNADIYFNYAQGSEVLPIEEGDDKIEVHRMVPKFMAQVNFSLEPYKNVYLRFENVFMTNWTQSKSHRI